MSVRVFLTLKVHSSCLVKPLLWMIFICFTKVLLPLSAAPVGEREMVKKKVFYCVFNCDRALFVKVIYKIKVWCQSRICASKIKVYMEYLSYFKLKSSTAGFI